MTPTIGRIVTYVTDGRNGLEYELPAIVTCTPDSHPGDYPDGEANPLPVPDEGCVHLTVFTPGGFGTVVNQPEQTIEQAKPEPISASDFNRDELDALAAERGLDPKNYETKAQVANAINDAEAQAVLAQAPTEQKDEDFVGAAGFTPGSGTYVEWNVPFHEGPDAVGNFPARSCRFPTRV